MMNRIYKTNFIKRSLLVGMAAVTLFSSTVLPSHAVCAITNVVSNQENSIEGLQEVVGTKLGHSNDSNGIDAVSRAESWIGRAEYVWGACSPGYFDPSGFVSYCLTGSYKRIGTTDTFRTWPQTSKPSPGDVCIYSGHCGIYAGNGEMIHVVNEKYAVRRDPVQAGTIFVISPY